MNSRLSQHLDPELFHIGFMSTSFSPYAQNQVHNILNHGIFDQAVSRVWVEAITIDWSESLDLDDAIWAEKTKNWYCVWIHIADVAEAIPLFSPLDREALQRTTSIYRRDHIINMFPNELSNGPLSLDENWVKKTMTLQIDLDDSGHVLRSSFYESHFKNLKRYDYQSFWEDYENRDSSHYSTIHLLKEISDKLRINRLKKWGIVWYMEDDRRMYIWSKQENHWESYSAKISHDIIEALMVLANTTTWEYLIQKGGNAIFKHHVWLDERSFYTQKPWFHTWLWVNNYTHFTSPIRRYVDVVIHRIIKALERWEELPYNISDLNFISEHSNNTRLKVETLWSQIDFEYRWKEFLKNTRKRLGTDPEVHHMKYFIRDSIYKKKKIPTCMKKAIKEKINTAPIDTWGWAIWVILFWKDNDLKEFLKKKLLEYNNFRPWKVLNMIWQTQLLQWEEMIFQIDEIEKENSYSITVKLHWNKISSYSMNVWKLWDIWSVKWRVRRRSIKNIFDYFIQL